MADGVRAAWSAPRWRLLRVAGVAAAAADGRATARPRRDTVSNSTRLLSFLCAFQACEGKSSSSTGMACTRPAAQSIPTLARVVGRAPADADDGVHSQADLRAPHTRVNHRSTARTHSFPDTPGVHARCAEKQARIDIK